ncbi:hypothetical protein Q8F55_008159 [Vanrija albida]|uniref:Zn(2)-C6 fungal-type domain-containing protein n=1 Tax=Vanrija albida TaxID=181172 RepID=A0ABR3PVN1_9TREE
MNSQEAQVFAAFPALYGVDKHFVPALWSYTPLAHRPSDQAVEAQRATFGTPGIELIPYDDACGQCKLGRKFCLSTHGPTPPCHTCFDSYTYCDFGAAGMPAGMGLFEPQAHFLMPVADNPAFWASADFMIPVAEYTLPGPQADFDQQDDFASALGFDSALLPLLDPQPAQPELGYPEYGPSAAPVMVPPPPPAVDEEEDEGDEAGGDEGGSDGGDDTEQEEDGDEDVETDDDDDNDSPPIPPPYPTPASSRQVSSASMYSTSSGDTQHTVTAAPATPATPRTPPRLAVQATNSFQADLNALLAQLHPAPSTTRVALLQPYVTSLALNPAEARSAAAALDEAVLVLQKRASHALLSALIAYRASGALGANPDVSERLALQAQAASDEERLNALEQIMPSKLLFGGSPVPKGWSTAKAAARVDALMSNLNGVGRRVVIGAFIDLIYARAEAHRAAMEE